MDQKAHCKNLLLAISDYVDGALADDLCRELERHLAECQNCRVVVDTLRKTIDIVHEMQEPAVVPGDVRRRLFRRLDLSEFAAPELRPGDRCPKCQAGILDYDGMLNLACDQCGFTLSGCFT